MNLDEVVNYILGQYTRDTRFGYLDLNRIRTGIIKNTVNEILDKRYSIYRCLVDEEDKLIYRVILTDEMQRNKIIKAILNELKHIEKIDNTVENSLKMIKVRLFQLSEQELQEKDISQGEKTYGI